MRCISRRQPNSRHSLTSARKKKARVGNQSSSRKQRGIAQQTTFLFTLGLNAWSQKQKDLHSSSRNILIYNPSNPIPHFGCWVMGWLIHSVPRVHTNWTNINNINLRNIDSATSNSRDSFICFLNSWWIVTEKEYSQKINTMSQCELVGHILCSSRPVCYIFSATIYHFYFTLAWTCEKWNVSRWRRIKDETT